MFWYAASHLTKKQMEYMESKNVHFLENGRISLAGLNDKNINKFVETFAESYTYK
jgi:aspartate/tyrosine/aromatic aminotransferase